MGVPSVVAIDTRLPPPPSPSASAPTRPCAAAPVIPYWPTGISPSGRFDGTYPSASGSGSGFASPDATNSATAGSTNRLPCSLSSFSLEKASPFFLGPGVRVRGTLTRTGSPAPYTPDPLTSIVFTYAIGSPLRSVGST